MAPRPLSHSRRQRLLALPPRPPHWRPRVSSPLTCEITFGNQEEKTDCTQIFVEPTSGPSTTRQAATLNEKVSRPRVSRIITCLLIDSLLSFCLCQMALQTLLNLRRTVASIPLDYKANGKVMLCLPLHHTGSNFTATPDYPIFPNGKLLSAVTEIPENCSFLSTLLVKLGQSGTPSSFIPLLVTCFITLKLAFGLLFMRTSTDTKAPFTYLRNTALFHLLITYTGLVFIKLNFKPFLNHYPALEKALTTSSDFMFFILGFLACLCTLGLFVMPLLWIFSRKSEHHGTHFENYSIQHRFRISSSRRNSVENGNPLMLLSEKDSAAVPKQNQKTGPSIF